MPEGGRREWNSEIRNIKSVSLFLYDVSSTHTYALFCSIAFSSSLFPTNINICNPWCFWRPSYAGPAVCWCPACCWYPHCFPATVLLYVMTFLLMLNVPVARLPAVADVPSVAGIQPHWVAPDQTIRVMGNKFDICDGQIRFVRHFR